MLCQSCFSYPAKTRTLCLSCYRRLRTRDPDHLATFPSRQRYSWPELQPELLHLGFNHRTPWAPQFRRIAPALGTTPAALVQAYRRHRKRQNRTQL